MAFFTLKNWLVQSIVLKELKKVFRKYLKGKLLDIGCGTKPLEKYLKPFVEKHVGLDHQCTLHDRSKIDLFGEAYKIPSGDAEFDCAVSTAVLEHLEEPLKALKETNRVLKKGAYAVYTIPLFWHLHEEPRDFFRFTKHGIRYLFLKSGFEITELKALSGFWVTFGQESVYYLWRFRRWGMINPLWWLIPPVGLLIQSICYLFNFIDRSEEFTWMYLVVAKKV